MKRITALSIIALGVILVFGCVPVLKSTPQEIQLTVKAVDQPVEVAEEEEGDGIARTMQVQNREAELSHLSFKCDGEVFTKLWSALTVNDVTAMWNDIFVLEKTTDIRTIHLFINSPGGDAFSGLALADEIKRAQALGFTVIGHASGIVASAAVPIFAVCNTRIAAPSTIFMVHETSIWKWPGRETHSDIISQGKLMDLLRDRYMQTLTDNSNLSREEWGTMEAKTTWFSAEKAKKWGLVDKIE